MNAIYFCQNISEFFFKGMRDLWMWTMTVFSFALFLRGEEPLRLKLRHLKLPSNYSGT